MPRTRPDTKQSVTAAVGMDSNALLQKPIWSLREVAVILDVHPRTVRRMFDRGELPGRRFGGGQYRFLRDTILAWLATDQESDQKPDVLRNAVGV